MKRRIIFLLEEPSMKTFLLEFLPRLFRGWRHGEDFLLVPHEGKSDLEKSIARKLKAWREPNAKFVIVRDNDGADCQTLKVRLLRLCQQAARQALVRLVCQELESWHLADVSALKEAYPQHGRAIARLIARFPNPDDCPKPSRELRRAVPEFQKQDAARRMGRLVSPERTCSASFRVFVSGVQRMACT
jgi:hypothetical protein